MIRIVTAALAPIGSVLALGTIVGCQLNIDPMELQQLAEAHREAESSAEAARIVAQIPVVPLDGFVLRDKPEQKFDLIAQVATVAFSDDTIAQ